MTSDKLFSGSKVTVINFWFTTCKPCVGELGDLEALNKELASKGGQVVGVNSFTLDGDAAAISEAKDILAKKGVTYKNVWFASSSEAGKFTSELFSYPTTYVVDRERQHRGRPDCRRDHVPRAAENAQQAHRPGNREQRGISSKANAMERPRQFKKLLGPSCVL